MNGVRVFCLPRSALTLQELTTQLSRGAPLLTARHSGVLLSFV